MPEIRYFFIYRREVYFWLGPVNMIDQLDFLFPNTEAALILLGYFVHFLLLQDVFIPIFKVNIRLHEERFGRFALDQFLLVS
jgi:hypothetical protein